jgi:DNA-binding GntR family transcriptional regulator
LAIRAELSAMISKTHRRSGANGASKTQLRTATTFDAVVYRLLDEIVVGKLKPGMRLREQDLSRALGVSRTPIREAFRRLERDGLIVIHSRQGAHVSPISAKDAEDLYRVRVHLSGLVAHLAAAALDNTSLRHLRRLTAEIQEAAKHKDFVRFQKAYVAFHDIITAATDNAWLRRTIDSLTLAIRRYGFITLRLPGVLEHSARAHSALLDALSRRDRVEAERVMRQMTERYGEQLVAYLRTVDEYLGAGGSS